MVVMRMEAVEIRNALAVVASVLAAGEPTHPRERREKREQRRRERNLAKRVAK